MTTAFDTWFYSTRDEENKIDGVGVPLGTTILYKHCHNDVNAFAAVCELLEQAFNAGQVPADWLPTAENINALPEPIRRYVHDMESNADPAGTVREVTQLRDLVRELSASNRMLRDQVAAFESQGVPDALREEAMNLASILSGMVEGGYSDLETLYTEDQADGDAFVKRAAEVLEMLASAPPAPHDEPDLPSDIETDCEPAPQEVVEHQAPDPRAEPCPHTCGSIEFAVACKSHEQSSAVQPVPVIESDMFWDHKDPEEFGHDIGDIVCNYGPGDKVKIDCAFRMQTITVLVKEGCDYEIVSGSVTHPAPQAIPPELDVRTILLAIEPGADGMGEEVYAKSVAAVEAKLTAMDQELEEWQLGIKRLPAPQAERSGCTAGTDEECKHRSCAAQCPKQANKAQPDTLYLLRRLLSNQHTLTGSEFREELTKIVEQARTVQQEPTMHVRLGVDGLEDCGAGDVGAMACYANTEQRPAPQAKPQPLSDEQIEIGRAATFSTNNPFCPCDSKTMRKAVRWAEAAHGITKE